VLSANTSAQDQRESAKAGPDAHLGKPIQVESLLQTLQDVVA
jgi:CheY-like chemotaxis protein